jgi:hypothetical protein
LFISLITLYCFPISLFWGVGLTATETHKVSFL